MRDSLSEGQGDPGPDARDPVPGHATHNTPGATRAVEALSHAAQRSGSVAEMQLVDGARQLLRARIKMARIAPKGLLRDSAWDMMLELFISGQEGGILFVKQLLHCAGESTTAALRRIDRLEEAGFIERFPDPLDRRRVIVRLQDRGRSAMFAMLEDVFDTEEATSKGEEQSEPGAGGD